MTDSAAPVQHEPTAAAGLERIYVLTGGRGGPTGRARLDLVTLVVARASQEAGRFPEHRAILRLCRRQLSVAELSAHLRLPFSATAVLIEDLVAQGLAVARQPRAAADLPDPALLEEVLRALERL